MAGTQLTQRLSITCSPREIGNLRALYQQMQEATQRFTLAFSHSCYARGYEAADFAGFDGEGMNILIPETDGA